LEEQKIKVKVGFTSGDMNGVGSEILLSLLSDNKLLSLITPIIYAPVKNLKYISSQMGLDLSFNKVNSPKESQENKINVIDNFKTFADVSFGDLNKEMGKTAFQSIKTSVRDLNDNKIDVLVTAPINKKNILHESFDFMGHTDFLNKTFDGDAMMFMVSQDLKIALLTEHIPIDKITENISKDLIEKKIKTIDMSMKKDFGIQRPKIAILSINPHVGDDGIIGNQDQEILIPALKELSESYLIFGPFPSDSFFGSDLYKKYDAILAIYHDQGLIPFKTIAFGNGVNFTAGLDIVRTSPDHGTGFDIAGKGIAQSQSMIEAIKAAVEMTNNSRLLNTH